MFLFSNRTSYQHLFLELKIELEKKIKYFNIDNVFLLNKKYLYIAEPRIRSFKNYHIAVPAPYRIRTTRAPVQYKTTLIKQQGRFCCMTLYIMNCMNFSCPLLLLMRSFKFSKISLQSNI
jgi:hypothetical protein